MSDAGCLEERYRAVVDVAAGCGLRQGEVFGLAEGALDFVGAREHGMHALRHFYASVLLDSGESVKAVSEYMGHADPAMTLRVYAHLMPNSRERSRRAVDRVLGPPDDEDRGP